MSAAPPDWYRINKSDGTITRVDGETVARRLQHTSRDVSAALASGRGSTAFAIYSTDAHLTDDERAQLTADGR